MARYQLATEGVGVYQDTNGNAVADVPFVLTGGPLYAASSGGTEQAVLTTDSKGRARGWLDPDGEPGEYGISYNGGDVMTFQVGDAALSARTLALEGGSRKFFPVPTGGDDAAELLSRLGAGEKDIALRRDTYNWNQVLGTIPAGSHISGEGRGTIVNKNVNGTLATLADSVILERMKIVGNGATRTGQAFVLSGTDGHQTMRDMSVTDFDGFILDFAVDAGSLSFFENCEFWQTNGSSGGSPTDAKYAVRISATTQAAAVPRKFVGCESGGYQFIDFGGGGGTTLTGGGYLGEVKFRSNTTAVKILGVRLGGATTTLTIDGGQNVIQGCDIYPALTIAASAQGNVIGPNTMNTTPYVTDSSGNNTNLVTLWGQSYTPTWTASGTAPALGNGTLVGYWSRSGNLINFAIRLIAGTTTTFGTGTWRFALPMAPSIGIPQIVPALLYDGSANDYANIHGHLLGGGVGYLTFPYPALGSVGPTIPWTWATTDIVHVSGSYMA